MKPALFVFLCLCCLVQLANARGEAPTGAQLLADITLETVVTGLDSPVYATNAGDGSRRLFIVEQAGRIKVLKQGFSSPTVFLDITSKVLTGGERGLLGLAF